jgi:hypothetical protein
MEYLLLQNVPKDVNAEQKMAIKKKTSSAFKTQAAMAALTGDKTLAQLSSQEFEVHPNQIPIVHRPPLWWETAPDETSGKGEIPGSGSLILAADLETTRLLN